MSDTSMSNDEYEQCRLLMVQCITLITCAAGATALSYSLPLDDKTPYHTSTLTGADWVCELLDGHPEQI